MFIVQQMNILLQFTDVCVQRSASPVGIGGYWQFNILCTETGMHIKGLVQIQTMHCIFVQSGEGEDFGEAGRENDSLANYV